MDNRPFLAILVDLLIAAVAVFWVVHKRGDRGASHREDTTELTVTDSTTWEVQLNGITVATIAEHVVAEIDRRVNREWWLGMGTALSEFAAFVRLVAVSIAAGLIIEAVLITLTIATDQRGVGYVLHAVFSASEATLRSGVSLFWQFGMLFSVVYFALALMIGSRHRAHDFVAEAWRRNVRRAAGVAPAGDLSLVLTHETRQLWRSPRQIAVDRIRSH